MQEETGASPDEVTRAFILVRDIYGFEALWAAIDALDNQVPAAVQSEMLIEAGRLRAARDALVPAPAPREAAHRRGARDLPARARGLPPAAAGDPLGRRPRDLRGDGRAARGARACPPELARDMAGLDALYAVLDATEVARETGQRPGGGRAALLRAGGRPRAALVRRAHHGAADRHDVAGARAERASRRPREPAARPHDARWRSSRPVAPTRPR